LSPTLGWQVRGIDPWRAVAEAGRKYYRLPIEIGRIETAATIPAQSQDIVMAIDVLQLPPGRDASWRPASPR